MYGTAIKRIEAPRSCAIKHPQPSKHLRDRGDDGGKELESFDASNDSISRLVTMNRFDEEYWKQWTEVRGKEGKREEEVCVVGSK